MSQYELVTADVEENKLLVLDKNILKILLKDRSSGRNIIWATDDYAELGAGYAVSDEIALESITGVHGDVIRPRALKSKEEQGQRTRNMAEVFTPLWICNKMNNLADKAWFERENVFNTENGNEWHVSEGKVAFEGEKGAKGWITYLASKCLEITCGEAPYLVSRYDTLTGELVPLGKRMGILDRKLRVINERTRNLKDKQRAKKRWVALAKLALQSTYGYEWAGDNVLLARENLLFTVNDYYAAKFGELLPNEVMEQFAKIISWNIWQMDGLKTVVPHSCHDYKKERKAVSPNLFSAKDFGVRTLKRSMSFCEVNENELQKCQGCLKDNVDLHNGVYCKIKNWSTGKVLFFKDMLGGEGSESVMSKDFKFDVVIGNPPYQVSDGGQAASAKPVYNYFVDSVKKIRPNFISMIMPARWYAGGKGLNDFRESMLKDKHIKLLHDYADSNDCFPSVNIAGGVCYFLWDLNYQSNCQVYNHKKGAVVSSLARPLNEYSVFIRDNTAILIIRKILAWSNSMLSNVVKSRNAFSISSFERGLDEKVNDNDVILLSSKGKGYYPLDKVIDRDNILDKYKVVITYAMSGGNKPSSSGDYQVISSLQILEPQEVCTETYLVLDVFDDRKSADSMMSYVSTKFFRFLLLQSLSSIHITKDSFAFIPTQNFSHPWTDEMLYKKYNLTNDEVAFIESMIKPME